MSDYAPLLQQVLDREPDRPGGTVGAEVEYDADGVRCAGYLARPADAAGPVPGILVVHDWLGVTDATRFRCDMLARLGYAAFAADVYGADVRPTPGDAAQVAGGWYADEPAWRRRLTAGLDRLRADDAVDGARVAALGYCFGGSAALQLARTGTDLAAAISFHGRLSTGPAEEAAGIRATILVLTGAADPVVPDDAVQDFEDELRTAPDVDWTVTTYAGAMHAFTVPTADSPDHGAAYDERADRRSWAAMKALLAEVL